MRGTKARKIRKAVAAGVIVTPKARWLVTPEHTTTKSKARWLRKQTKKHAPLTKFQPAKPRIPGVPYRWTWGRMRRS